MRYCSHCKKWFAGRPMFCQYCRRTWNYRLCEKGHKNPLDPNINFCIECGSPNLTDGMKETLSSKIFGWINLKIFRRIGLAMFVILVLLDFSKSGSAGIDTIITLIIAIGILCVALGILPKETRSALRRVWRIIRKMINSREQNAN